MTDDLIRRHDALKAIASWESEVAEQVPYAKEVFEIMSRREQEILCAIDAISKVDNNALPSADMPTLINTHDVACILADVTGSTCACDFNDNDEWLPKYCDFADTCCPNPIGVACWEQYLTHRPKVEQYAPNCGAYMGEKNK